MCWGEACCRDKPGSDEHKICTNIFWQKEYLMELSKQKKSLPPSQEDKVGSFHLCSALHFPGQRSTY